MGRTKLATVGLGISFAAVGYFNYVGNSLGKTQGLGKALGVSYIPDSIVSVLVYQLGGISALSRVQSEGVDPITGEHGRSLFIFLRTASAAGLPVHTPETIAGYVNIPIPFNVYTGFGDVWMDLGFIGLFAYFLLIGIVLTVAHVRARAGQVGSAWLAAVLISILSSTPLGMRLFNLDTVILVVVGAGVFRLLSSAPVLPKQTPSTTTSPGLSTRATSSRQHHLSAPQRNGRL